jgi:hypothetical protein
VWQSKTATSACVFGRTKPNSSMIPDVLELAVLMDGVYGWLRSGSLAV